MNTKEHLKSWTKNDFTLDWFSGSGAGGQHRNKHQNCLRLTEKETGISVVSQSHKSRKANLKEALTRIAPLLVHYYFPKEEKERAPITDHIRTYNECENRVVDIASGNKSAFKDYDISDDIEKRKIAIE